MADTYPVPSVSPLDSIVAWRDLLLAAIDEALDRADVWPEDELETALGYVEDLKLWVSLLNDGSGGMQLISQQILTSAVSTITFASIPGSYKKLILQVTARGTAAADTAGVSVRFNGDSGANYDYERIASGTGSLARSAGVAVTMSTVGKITAANGTSGQGGRLTVEIPDYADANFRKEYLSQSGYRATLDATGGYFIEHIAGNWRNTNPITQIDVLCGTGNFAVGSIFTLWGVE